jgi:hypothetical protein
MKAEVVRLPPFFMLDKAYMKNMNLIVIGLVCVSILTQGFARADSGKSVDVNLQIRSAVVRAKEAVIVEGLSNQDAAQELLTALDRMHVNSNDLVAFVDQYASQDEKIVFNQALSLGNLSDDLLVSMLSEIGEHQQKDGAHFKVSCGVGLGIGIPLILAGIVLVIAQLEQKDPSIDTKRKYEQLIDTANQDYLKNKSQLNAQMSDYNSLLQVSQVKVNELNRQIASGNYSPEQLASLQFRLNELNSNMAQYRSSMGGIAANLVVIDSQHEQLINQFNGSEQKELDLIGRMDRKLYLKAGIASAVAGIPFVFLGAKNCK